MRIVLVGAPGSGKGTQGRVLAERLGLPYVGSGDLLRARAAAEPGGQLAAVLDRGDLVGDDAALAAVSDALAAAEAAGGYVLDGFPRTAGQARDLDPVTAPDAGGYLALPHPLAPPRLPGRAPPGPSDDLPPPVR